MSPARRDGAPPSRGAPDRQNLPRDPTSRRRPHRWSLGAHVRRCAGCGRPLAEAEILGIDRGPSLLLAVFVCGRCVGRKGAA